MLVIVPKKRQCFYHTKSTNYNAKCTERERLLFAIKMDPSTVKDHDLPLVLSPFSALCLF